MMEEDEPASERTVGGPSHETEPPNRRDPGPTPADEAVGDFDAARTQFVANSSRDLRTPLILLLGPLQDILDSPASTLAPTSRNVLEVARRNALRLLKLLDTLPGFSGIERGRTGEAADLAAFTAALTRNFRTVCDEAGLRLIVDCPPLSETVPLDRDVWETIVLNLVANAFKSTIEGSIEVRLRAHDGNVQLIVSDTGAGIPSPDVFDHFDRDARARNGTSDRIGFGLASVLELVHLQNGSIDVQNAPGRGTSVTVLLPFGGHDSSSRRRAEGRVAGRTVPTAQDGGAVGTQPPFNRPEGGRPLVEHSLARDADSTSRGHVVIAEDHAETREYLNYVLQAAGFVVDATAAGPAALAICQARAPDALVSDVLMPGLNGIQLIERLRADERTAVIPVLLLSVHGDEDSRIAGIAAGADDYLVKPLSGRELVARVDGAVRLARLRRETARREQERFRELSGRLVEVQEAERRQLSAELHDRTSPQLAAIHINLEMLNKLLGARATEDVRALLDDTGGLIADTTLGIREISSNLRPTVLDDGGLLPALAAYAQQFTQRTGVAVRLHTQDATGTLAPAMQSSLFRIVQEALTNCAKHAKARGVTIRLSADSSHLVALTIADDGVGFDVERHGSAGLGLLTMRERAEFLGGTFSLESKPGEGTRIQVLV
jgi:signal transduction histidine kinase